MCGQPVPLTHNAPTQPCPTCHTAVLIPQDNRLTLPPLPPANLTPNPALLLNEDFAIPNDRWETGEPETGVGLGYTEHGYGIVLHEPGSWWETYANLNVAHIRLETQVLRAKGPKEASFGVLARVNATGCYSFEIDGEGRYGIYKTRYAARQDPDATLVLAEGDRPGVVRLEKEVPNHLEAVCHGHHLRLTLNGRLVLEAKDAEFANGDVGLLATLEDCERGGLDVRFRYLRLTNLALSV